jgi:hypothetical protein
VFRFSLRELLSIIFCIAFSLGMVAAGVRHRNVGLLLAGIIFSTSGILIMDLLFPRNRVTSRARNVIAATIVIGFISIWIVVLFVAFRGR